MAKRKTQPKTKKTPVKKEEVVKEVEATEEVVNQEENTANDPGDESAEVKKLEVVETEGVEGTTTQESDTSDDGVQEQDTNEEQIEETKEEEEIPEISEKIAAFMGTRHPGGKKLLSSIDRLAMSIDNRLSGPNGRYPVTIESYVGHIVAKLPDQETDQVYIFEGVAKDRVRVSVSAQEIYDRKFRVNDL